jgi:cytochrome c oxidase subunit 2
MFSEAVSIVGKQVDAAFLFILWICLAMLVLITFLMVFFVIKYRRSIHPNPVNIEGNNLLEIVWTVIPTLLVLAMFYYGWIGYQKMEYAPDDVINVKVTARMWSWLFEYENGRQSDILNVPLGKAVKLELISKDVLHSFYVPAFRLKKDMVPGLKTSLWFEADEAGTYDLFCAEFCGVGHSAMLSSVVVLPEEEYTAWLKGEKPSEGEETVGEEPQGLQLLQVKGCRGCHSIDGSPLVGPTLKGLYESKRKVMAQGQEKEIVADEEYLRRSLLEPAADVVVGFPPIMPSQEGLLTEEEIVAIIEYIKTLK